MKIDRLFRCVVVYVMIYRIRTTNSLKRSDDNLRGDILEERVCLLTRKRELSRISFHACMENGLFSHFFLSLLSGKYILVCLNDDEQ